MVYLFATRLSHKLPDCFSPVMYLIALGVDSMLLSENNLKIYTFPPFGMIHQVILYPRLSNISTMMLIALFWPLRLWFPKLLILLVDVALTLPSRKDMLEQSHLHHLHHSLSCFFSIYGDSSSLPVMQNSLRQCLDGLPHVKAVF